MTIQLGLWDDDDAERRAILHDQIQAHRSDAIGVLMAISEAACRVRTNHPDDRVISPNDVRPYLRPERTAPMLVRPSVVGPVFAQLVHVGLLRRLPDPIPSTDNSRAGRNAGKWVTRYRVSSTLYRWLDCTGELDTHQLEELVRILLPRRHGLAA